MSDLLRTTAELGDTAAEFIVDSKRLREWSRILMNEADERRAARKARIANRPPATQPRAMVE